MTKTQSSPQIISLSFDKTAIAVAGFPFGVKIFNEQVKGIITSNTSVTIVFPSNIIKVSSSFWQGFFKKWIEDFGLHYIRCNVRITPDKLNERMNEDMPYWIKKW